MKLTTRLASTLSAAAMIAASFTGIPAANAGTPAASVAGDTPRAVVTQGEKELWGWQPRWRDIIATNPERLHEVWAYSPSMNRDVPLFVISPRDNSVPRPIVYVLNGGDGGEGNANWVKQTDIVDFYADKDVWVVIPMAGKFSYYTDWVQDSPFLGGKQNWETFMTKELPEPLERALGANGQRAILGMSMSATTTLLYAEHQPGFYDMIGSFSGCAQTSAGAPLEYLRLTLNRGKSTPEMMWGPVGGPTFAYNDALLNAEKLRGQQMYISAGTGTAGPHDLWSTPYTQYGDSLQVGVHVINGGIIEAAVNRCTHDLKAKLDKAGIGADWNLRPVGTHSWGYWQDDLRLSWPVIARSFGWQQ
ncbi:alpha/beta hydrolase [Corynebacterium choanae]|uniref:Diacylglycerol acyltransferase/mycolyltransferase Ag85A n=1 Tax=Corynebacterium choanae TaxID=1862358 RepID=A0A3G6J957_9CORY|nr:alpha/beta hydrolase family protein [Corynebacterium choanae]AZA14526.1 Diacylglycerol acyltransferase/mycolyltransferase Ag85A precursor [Corynebacterium choanae]